LSKPEVWYIVDGKRSEDSEAITILICSPLKSHYKTFDTRHPDVRYMSPWSWDEINTCRAIIFANLEEKKVRELYTEWGGIPRYILEGALTKGIQSQLNLAINLCDESIFKYIGGEDISHELIYIWMNSDDNEYYTETTVKFASDYVGQQVILVLKKIIIDKCRREVDLIMEGVKVTQSLIVFLIFEQIAHQVLRNGGSFKRRSLDTNDEDVITFPKRKLNLFNQIDEIQDGTYSTPLEKTFPSVDAIIAPNCLLQMTTAKDHNIKING
ncbi:hypothetical protein C1646_632203, partial [Rhizophagus diaphanus]